MDHKRFSVKGGDVPPDVWVQVAGVLEPGRLAVYVNGVLQATTYIPPPYDTNGLVARGNLPLYVGGHPSWNTMLGSIDCVGYYQGALSAQQMRDLYNVQSPKCGCHD